MESFTNSREANDRFRSIHTAKLLKGHCSVTATLFDAVFMFLYVLLLNFSQINPLNESFSWTFHIAIIAAPVWISVSSNEQHRLRSGLNTKLVGMCLTCAR